MTEESISDLCEDMNTYELIVEGVLDTSTLPFLNGFNFHYDILKDRNVTILSGDFSDQSALGGVIDLLIDSRYKLLSLKLIKEKRSNSQS